MIGKRLLNPRFLTLACVALGLLLIWSGTQHLKNPQSFFIGVVRYKLFGETMCAYVAQFIPVFECVLGVCLISNCCPLAARSMSAGLFFSFACVQASALVRGLDIECACFGASSDKNVSFTWVAINIAISAVLVFCSFQAFRAIAPTKGDHE